MSDPTLGFRRTIPDPLSHRLLPGAQRLRTLVRLLPLYAQSQATRQPRSGRSLVHLRLVRHRTSWLPPALTLAVGLLVLSAPAGLAAQEVVSSPHGTLELECTLCHAADGWRPARIGPDFRHAKFGFVLAGAHATTSCMACHVNLSFADAPTRCSACHRDVHQGELGPDCSRCHSERNFLDRSRVISLHQVTRFPLAGAHLAADCLSCHPATGQGHLQFVGKATECYACHQREFAAARDPDHQAGGYTRDCSVCHAVSDWSRARFDHQASGFPLTGAHRALICSQCHAGNRFTGTAVSCAGCHQQDFDQATRPNHVRAAFPSDCVACHTTRSWTGSYDHGRTSFPLTGRHKSVPCLDCHGDNVYQGKPATCVSCHQPDYDQTTDPGHRAAGFPTDCASCHKTSTWDGATFDHDAAFFRIYSGHHREAWSTCADCHTDPANYAVFTCVTCHTRSRMDSEHRGRSGYQFSSPVCLGCHRNG